VRLPRPGRKRDEADAVVPAEVLLALGLPRRQHVLAAAQDSSGRWWVATHDALFMPVDVTGRAASSATGEQVPWEEIDKAEWDRDTSRFTLLMVGAPAPVHTRFENADDLLTVLRERVTTSVVAVRTIPLDDAAVVARVGGILPGDAIVTVRRRAADRSLFTQVAFSAPLDPSLPEVRLAGEATAAMARAELGV
jgi:hypothetical protein